VKWSEHADHTGANRNECTIFVGKFEELRELWRPRYKVRWRDNTKMDLKI
jgi:hypothetical protein